jgi:hypothetical protein
MSRLRRHDDDGATLIIVLIIVTVIGVVLGVVLSLVDNNVRSSVGIADEANLGYGIDGVAQVAVKQLQQGSFPGSNCSSSTAESTIFNNWVPANGSSKGASMAVQCSPNPNTGQTQQVANASPGSAILTLAPTSSGEDGITVNDQAPGNGLSAAVKVRGGIFSNSTIKVTAGQLANTWTPPPSNPSGTSYVDARGACTGTIIVNAYATKTCNYSQADGKGIDPGSTAHHPTSYDPPTAPTGNAVISTCTAGDPYQSVSPPVANGSALITSAAALNSLTGCSKGIVWFQPGNYFFNFQDASDTWTIDNVFIVAGTPTSNSVLNSNPSASAWPGACIAPTVGGTNTLQGAEFVFAGDSRIVLKHQSNPGGQLTVCASNSLDGPPMAVYGLKTAVGAVPPQNGCISDSTNANYPCAVIYSDQSPNTTLTIQGTTYTPKAWLNVSLNNSTNQIFRWGLITYRLSINTTGSPDVSQNLIDVPDNALIPNPTPQVVYLNVFLCPGQSSCAPSGTLVLTAKVQLGLDGSVQLLSWSRQS